MLLMNTYIVYYNMYTRVSTYFLRVHYLNIIICISRSVLGTIKNVQGYQNRVFN